MSIEDIYRAAVTGHADNLRDLAYGQLLRNRPTAAVKTASGTALALTDSVGAQVQGLRVFGRSTQDGTPSPENPVPIVSAGDSGSITLDVNGRTLLCSTPNGLPGVPVSSGGNYTDESGQQWICDEIDFGRGVYVQRVDRYIYDGTTGSIGAFNIGNSTKVQQFNLTNAFKDYLPRKEGYCDALPCTIDVTSGSRLGFWFYTADTIVIGMSIESLEPYGFSSSSSTSYWKVFKAYLADHPLTFVYALAAPIETPLTAAELQQYRNLYTSAGGTTITNDAGVYMSADYYARV